jgi:SAM-dependent methyltransferase
LRFRHALILTAGALTIMAASSAAGTGAPDDTGQRPVTLALTEDAEVRSDRFDWEPSISGPEVIEVERIVRSMFSDPAAQDGLIRLATERFEDRDEVLDFLALRPGNRVLDLGCGVGWFTIPLAEAVGPRGLVYALEIRQEPIDVLRHRLRRRPPEVARRVRVERSTATSTGLQTHAVDVVLLAHLGFLLRDPLDVDTQHLLRDLHRAVRPGGRVVAVQWMGGPEGDDPLPLILNLEDAGFELHDAQFDPLNDSWLLELLRP